MGRGVRQRTRYIHPTKHSSLVISYCPLCSADHSGKKETATPQFSHRIVPGSAENERGNDDPPPSFPAPAADQENRRLLPRHRAASGRSGNASQESHGRGSAPLGEPRLRGSCTQPGPHHRGLRCGCRRLVTGERRGEPGGGQPARAARSSRPAGARLCVFSSAGTVSPSSGLLPQPSRGLQNL